MFRECFFGKFKYEVMEVIHLLPPQFIFIENKLKLLLE